MERIQHLPRAQQRFVMQVIDTVLAQYAETQPTYRTPQKL